MVDYMGNFEIYLDKLKKIDVSRVFTEDISFPEFVHLKYIDYFAKKSDDMSVQVSKLVESSGVTAQAVSKCLGILEKKNYIIRFNDKADRRAIQVKMTDYGKTVFEITQGQMHAVIDEVFSKFSREETDMFANLTKKFFDEYEATIDKMKTGGEPI